ncbi:hypothetical protein AA313_de0208589 [Arthrobotrys entomopaga]|nr:hypothetical protein AA313_de0208589 [Arthrobotrys entomopaga]
MKFSTVILAAAALATASAQLDAFPSCALNCLISSSTSSGCGLTDYKCACSSDAFLNGSTSCIKGACPVADQDKARTAAIGLCNSVGIDVSGKIPPVGESTTTTTPSGPTTTSAPPTGPTGGSPCKPKRFRRY